MSSPTSRRAYRRRRTETDVYAKAKDDPFTIIYTEPHVTKFVPLHDQMTRAFEWVDSVKPLPKDGFAVRTQRVLGPQERAQLDAWVGEYSDPPIYLRMHHTVTQCATSKTTNSVSGDTVMTFIFPHDEGAGSTFNAIKSVLEFCTEDVMTLLHIKDFHVTIKLINNTDNCAVIGSARIDGSEVIRKWQKQRPSGPQHVFRSVQINDLRCAVSQHDAVWHVSLAVSDPCVHVTLHGMQRIYYDIY